MPRIAKWREKYECVKYLAPRPVKFYFEDGVNELKTHTIYELIEETFESLLPKYYESFVDVKEVPYGRYNSDSDYRGS